MRPQRFQSFVIDLATNHPTATKVQTLAESGETKTPGGVAITTSTGVSRWGIVGQLPDGAKHDGFEDAPVSGDPVTPGDAPQAADAPEAWLAALLAHSQSPEIASIERWSTSEDARPDYFGLTVRFHNTARVFVRLL
ncbi:hypothetical protein GCM10010387_08920 [Streptomyces inusitatus]|uniref:Uncharacterized protein n=1 Tax=Streptomyces inusitatus TaxID=68221 RepID=A0A918PQU8_9ACTN|nr:hypothetical protein [Streptomyces inusitatus]GGZ18587.1 hypothetical protein GCM10010387_08920 [Streptomyces inusitatus]